MRTLALLFLAAFQQNQAPYHVSVIDDETGRGVPLVELRTSNEISFYTDSDGIAVIDEPALAGHRVYFKVRSHGYRYPGKVFDEEGAVILQLKPGGVSELKIHRTNIAERLYRITGEGIYRDTIMLGRKPPIRHPLLDGMVTGQDTAITALYQGRVFWCWGDTFGPANMNFNASCATSELPGHGGLDPAAGVDLTYFIDKGFSKRMLRLPRPGLIWLEGLFTAKDEKGRERLLATYTRQQGLKPPDERGVAVFNESRQEFEVLAQLPWLRSHVSSNTFRHAQNGKDFYWYMYPNQRVPDDWKSIQNPAAWEAFVDGKWTRGAAPPALRIELVDADTGKPTGAKPSCVAWNEFRQKWIMLAEKTGEVYYSESDDPTGPWLRGKKIVSHNQYNFYNVVHHPFFNQQNGRIIFFEGKYTDAFSGAKEKTPRYNYNQIMYRLRLDDPRLAQVSAPAPRR